MYVYLGLGLFLMDFWPYFLHLYPSSARLLPFPQVLILSVYLFSILLISTFSGDDKALYIYTHTRNAFDMILHIYIHRKIDRGLMD